MRFRQATLSDAYSIFELNHKTKRNLLSTENDVDKIKDTILKDPLSYLLIEIQGSIQGFISLIFDSAQGLCKLTRMTINPALPDGAIILKYALEHTIEVLREKRQDIEVIYTTTTSVSLDEQEITLKSGFKIFGVFPNLLGMDSSQLNGLSAFFLREETIEKRRQKEILLHPAIKPFYEIVQKSLELPEASLASDAENHFTEEAPLTETLEVIEASHFVQHRFQKHIENNSQLINFYPFYTPNTLITNPNQTCEVFVKINKNARFAAIIGEQMTIQAPPVSLYLEIQNILKKQGVSYIEIINDAEDVKGTDAILRSGFTPSAYFPAFKKQGKARRDFIVFGKSFEYLCRPNFKAHKSYIDFYREYYRIEGKNYFPDFF